MTRLRRQAYIKNELHMHMLGIRVHLQSLFKVLTKFQNLHLENYPQKLPPFFSSSKYKSLSSRIAHTKTYFFRCTDTYLAEHTFLKGLLIKKIMTNSQKGTMNTKNKDKNFVRLFDERSFATNVVRPHCLYALSNPYLINNLRLRTMVDPQRTF